jgi:ribosome-associated protein
MAKPKGFQWTRDDQDEVALERKDRRTRIDIQSENKALEALGLRLAAMRPGDLVQLPLDPDTLEAIATYVGIGGKSAKRRQLLWVQNRLRTQDLDELQEALDGEPESVALERNTTRWRTRLVDGGDPDLQAFLDAFPGADRQQLRALIRRARATEDPGRKSYKQLYKSLAQVISSGD